MFIKEQSGRRNSLQVDRILDLDFAKPMAYVDGVNLYQFVDDEPEVNTDPTGLFKSQQHVDLTNTAGGNLGVDPALLQQIADADQFTDKDLAAGTPTDYSYHAQVKEWYSKAQQLMKDIENFDCSKTPITKLVKTIGQLLHILQDFYSHTDYVEGSAAMIPFYGKKFQNLNDGRVVNPSTGPVSMNDIYNGVNQPVVHYYRGGFFAGIGGDPHDNFAADEQGFGRDKLIPGAYQRAYDGAEKQTEEAFKWIRAHMKPCCVYALFYPSTDDIAGDLA